LCLAADVDLWRGEGYRPIRRGIVTALHEVEVDGLSIYEWMRWSARRQFGMLPVYIRKKPEEFDKKVISKHPLIPM